MPQARSSVELQARAEIEGLLHLLESAIAAVPNPDRDIRSDCQCDGCAAGAYSDASAESGRNDCARSATPPGRSWKPREEHGMALGKRRRPPGGADARTIEMILG